MTGNINPRGFTLLETITVVAIFALTVTATLNIYLLFFKNASQVERQASVASDAKFVMQAVMDMMEVASLDYDYYAGTVPTTPTTLALITPQHETIRFRYNSTSQTLEMCAHRPVNSPCDDADVSMWTPLNEQDASPITSFQVWISPASNPFARSGSGSALSNEQPRITLVFSMTDRLGENGVVMQTTLTSRAYER